MNNEDLTWGEKTIMLSGGMMTALALVGITAVLPQIEADLAQSATDRLLIKLLVTIVGLTMVIGAPLTGFIIDRVGVRRLMIWGCIVYSAAGTAGVYLNGLPALFASRLILGVTAAGIATMSMTLINTRLRDIRRAKWMGAHVGVTLAGTIILHPSVGLLGEISWRMPFLLYSLGLVLALVAAIGLRDSDAGGSVADNGEQPKRLRDWFPFRYLLLAFAIGTITYIPMVYAPFVIRESGIASPTAISLVLLADSVIGAIVALLYGRSRRYLSSRGAFLTSFLFTGTGTLIVALAPNFVTVVAGMLVFGFGVGWFVPNLMTAASHEVDEIHQGRTVGLVKGAHYLAAPFATVLVEPAARALGPQGAMGACALLSFTVIAVMIARAASGARRPVVAPG